MIRGQRTLAAVLLGASVVFLWGCAGMEYVPGGRFFFYHKELPEAQRAIDAARKAGKDKECPADFQAAEKMKNDAYALYYACHTKEAIAKAKEAMALAASLCPRVAEAPKPAPTPQPAARPTISFSSSPGSIHAGDCATLTWSTTGASSSSIDPGIGSVDTSGSRRVCPDGTTRYTLTASGAGGSESASTSVEVTPAPAPIDHLTVHVRFDTGKAEIRKADHDELQKALHFVERYPGCKISVEGHTDSTGSAPHNQALSEKRAAAVKKYLVDHGAAAADKIQSVGYGQTRPIGDNKTAKGRSENRRVEIIIVSR